MPSAPDTRARAVRALAITSRLFEQACQEAGLSLPQYRLLLWVRAGPRRAAELAERIAVRRPTVTALVDGLSEQGYVRRIPVEGDRRGIKLELTDEGLAALDAAEATLGELLDAIAKAGDRRRILDGLDELAEVLEIELERRGTLPRR
jgi:DNA-binding MarR family transcriptional regulator